LAGNVSIEGPLRLAEDVRIAPVVDLDPAVRGRIEAADGDYTITRARSRLPTNIVDSDSAELLKSFHRPARIADAIVTYARRHNCDPRATLEQAYPMLDRLYRMQVLVPAEVEQGDPIQHGLRVGDLFEGFQLLRRLQVLDDNEVFLARDAGGRFAAVKFCSRPGARALVREARLLRRLAGIRVPAVFGLARAATGVALVTEWIGGVDAQEAAALLQGVDCARDEYGLLSLCVEIACAFADLHEAGVLHGDMNPRNILVEPSGSVRLIDLGLAQDSRRLRADQPRGGVPFYFEPEFGSALRAGRSVAVTPAGEQYSVAALLYHLWTGVHYLEWSLEREQMLRQVVEDDPVSFESRRVPTWPELERILRRALDKSPHGRFPDMRSLADALRELLSEARERDRRATACASPGLERELLDRALSRYGLGGQGLKETLPDAPLASVHFGAAGVAYALLRMAQRRGDPRLLAAADLWSQKAYTLAGRHDAFYNEQLHIEGATVGEVSLFHSEAGLHCVRALVSTAQGDAAGVNTALKAFAEHTTRPNAQLETWAQTDVALGQAGLLLGCSELIESIPDVPLFDRGIVFARGGKLAAGVLARVQRESIESSDLTTLGIAHGWGGLLFSLLRWSRAAHAPADPVIAVRLRELASLAEPDGAGLRWPVRAFDSTFVDGWCNGSAGYAMLFALAQHALGDPTFGRLAEGAAVSAWSSLSRLGCLCCGQGGIGYALLALHRLTGQDVWLRRARAAAQRATADRSKHFPDHALYQGALGVALLADDLDSPERSAMPLFEPVGL
jgi:hypothetical protein